MMWSLLKTVTPNLTSSVNSELVYDLLLFHDLGEVASEDMPLVKQLQEGSSQKKEMESLEIDKITNDLPETTKKFIRQCFFDYSYAAADGASIEVLLARYINSIQGNHFAMVYGFDFAKHADLIMKIVNRYFMPVAEELVGELAIRNKLAANEVEALTSYHLRAIEEVIK